MTGYEREEFTTRIEIETNRDIEFMVITRKLNRLYAAQMDGDDTVRTRQRVAALEALCAALQGFPEAMAQ